MAWSATNNAWFRKTLIDSFTVPAAAGTLDYDSNTIKVALYDNGGTDKATVDYNSSTGYALAPWTTGEVANGNGYTTGGNTLGSKTIASSGGTLTIDAADTVWTTGASQTFTAYGALVYDSTATTKYGLVSVYFNGALSPANGGTLTIQWNVAGILTFA